ncbi:DUF3265 domain-containing protein [Vibrio parahaemolyticus]|nr:DUF3265 domain-containing protein [Vibrio parahaemolyticus]
MEGCVSTVSESKRITICLRVIRNVWHFYYASDLVVKVVCGGFGIALLTP